MARVLNSPWGRSFSAFLTILLVQLRAAGQPTYNWARTFGGSSGDDEVWAVDFDASGNVFVTGVFWGAVDFDPGPATDSRTSAGDMDIFLSKFNADGSYAWTRAIGGLERVMHFDSSGA